MADQDRPDPQFDAMTARLLHREALRRAAEELNTTSGPGLEGVLARISAEVTAEAARQAADAEARGTEARGTDIDATHSVPARWSPARRQSKP
jgi:hypothetical protein